MEHLTLNRRVSKTEYLSLKQTKKTNPKNFVIHRGRKLILKNYSKMTDQTKLKLDASITRGNSSGLIGHFDFLFKFSVTALPLG